MIDQNLTKELQDTLLSLPQPSKSVAEFLLWSIANNDELSNLGYDIEGCLNEWLRRGYNQNPNHKFNINREDYYLVLNPETHERTRSRLTRMAELGMSEVGIAQFGVEGVMSGLYIEHVWSKSDKDFNSYLDWVKEIIDKNKE